MKIHKYKNIILFLILIIIIVIFIIYKVRNVEHFYFLSSPSPSGSVPMCTEKFIVDVPAGLGKYTVMED